jgi:catechol 2,3-dioxygenase-like lactoylglutathione lyase family enzyme
MKQLYDHVLSFVWVSDWKRALSFYTNVLGFNKAYESEGWAELSVPGLNDSYIALNRWARDEQFPKNKFVTLRVRDLNEFRKHLEEKRVRFTGADNEFLDEGQGLKMFKFYDSEGNVLTAAQIDLG